MALNKVANAQALPNVEKQVWLINLLAVLVVTVLCPQVIDVTPLKLPSESLMSTSGAYQGYVN